MAAMPKFLWIFAIQKRHPYMIYPSFNRSLEV